MFFLRPSPALPWCILPTWIFMWSDRVNLREQNLQTYLSRCKWTQLMCLESKALFLNCFPQSSISHTSLPPRGIEARCGDFPGMRSVILDFFLLCFGSSSRSRGPDSSSTGEASSDGDPWRDSELEVAWYDIGVSGVDSITNTSGNAEYDVSNWPRPSGDDGTVSE
ncbi:hypothetical protein OGAPHI_000798 [Ogataea philodendri]|uniref:Uncharacterized protein n=1 Tax=Ogataea philodendri TaxID=1378263 RepID=A0A9P8PFH7_9ASCO|nr:uncharacterized protein OGAPHI_000798 [Ogataea philodendri]KAH3671087.1 hypothetical protein OGAPHI_000798 [Ogataea philodendri]